MLIGISLEMLIGVTQVISIINHFGVYKYRLGTHTPWFKQI